MFSNDMRASGKIWIEYRGKPLLGKGGAEILRSIKEEESILKATQTLQMSYRYVWGYIRDVQRALGEPILETFKGGKSGGGGARLTKLGQRLLDEYGLLEDSLNRVLTDRENWEAQNLKTSARNRLRAKVVSVEKHRTNAKVKIEVSTPSVVTTVITKETLEDLNLKVGDVVEAMVKSTGFMIAK